MADTCPSLPFMPDRLVDQISRGLAKRSHTVHCPSEEVSRARETDGVAMWCPYIGAAPVAIDCHIPTKNTG